MHENRCGRERRVVVLGGGMSGLAVAWRLTARGTGADVVEAAPVVGGLAGTHLAEGCFLDHGPHSFFSDDTEVLRGVLGLFDEPPPARPRKMRFLYEGRYIDYPLTARGVLLQMGLASGVRAALSLVRGRLAPRRRGGGGGRNGRTVEAWAVEHFGEHLYETFFRPYTEQFWKIPCAELSADTIPTHTRLSFASTLRLLLRRRRAHAGGSLIERETLPTFYPQGGFAEIPRRIAEAVVRAGGTVRVGADAERIERMPDGRVRVALRGGGEAVGDRVISTIPLPALVGMLSPPPPAAVREAAAGLGYRPLLVLGLVTGGHVALGCAYVHLLHRPYNRVFDMSAFSAAASPSGENVLAVEIPSLPGDGTWEAPAEELFERCIGPLAEDGILAREDVRRLILVRARHAYPVYRTGWEERVRVVMAHLGKLDYLATLGRSGEFRYMDADQCVRRAFDLADALTPGDGW